jgi:murein L,D-transpeptidase YcbB/YkuD
MGKTSRILVSVMVLSFAAACGGRRGVVVVLLPEPDGKVGGKTLEEMNVSAEDRLREIDLNLERWRWMPGEMGDHYLVVNIPEYRLRAVRGGETELEMRVIVGKPAHETPVFSDIMTFLVLNPEWNIPASIASSEVVPKILSNPGYAESQGNEVVNAAGERVPASSVLGRRTGVRTAERGGDRDGESAGDNDRGGFFSRVFGGGGGDDDEDERADAGGERERFDTGGVTSLPAGHRLRQAPGRQNPLGQVKFMFPNEHNIYLHDTPADNLFAQTERDFSHGCIRLERPLDLADYVLRGDSSWNPDRIRQVVASGERTEVTLPEELPVHLTYFTAWVGDDGRVNFREDLYGHDQRLGAALDSQEPLSFDPVALRGEAPARPEEADGDEVASAD